MHAARVTYGTPLLTVFGSYIGREGEAIPRYILEYIRHHPAISTCTVLEYPSLYICIVCMHSLYRVEYVLECKV